ncbi:DUF99 family protein [Candidatus Woesearchaeota archaeon]|nr:DUF99 family protein [Candidatus Woesearchaeota archaeon]
MKSEVRVLGIDDAPFNKFKDKRALVIGCFFRGSVMLEGVLSTHIRVDGDDATSKIIEMINSSKFKPQVQVVFLDGLNMAGFNMIDIHEVHRKTKKPVVVIVRRKPDTALIKRTLEKLNMAYKITYIEKAGEPIPHKKIYFQMAGLSEEEARAYIDISTRNSFIPEALRVAHIIGAGLVKGESRGRA